MLLASSANASTKLESRIDELVSHTQHMQRVMGVPVSPTRHTYRTTLSGKYKRWVYLLWKRRHTSTYHRFAAVPYRSAWECIHRYEGSWVDDGGPYYGGLQMDISFQTSYGSYLLRIKGTANNWSPLEQMWVAYKAYRSGRGFYPWPNTARACSLI